MLWLKYYRPLLTFLLPAVAAFVFISCSISGDEIGKGFEIVKEYDRANAGSFTLMISNTGISTAEELTLVLEVKAAEQWRVAFPEIQGSLDKFKVVDRGMEMRKLDGDRNLIYTRTYTLEPFLPGDYIIAPLEISFEEEGGFNSFSLISGEIAVVISSVLPPQLGEQDIEEIWGPLSLQRRIIIWIGIAGIILAALGTGLFYVTRRLNVFRLGAEAQYPWEAALVELKSLLAKKLIEHGRYREFYDRISDLMRCYVERRFSIRAAEQTTEELIQHFRSSNAPLKYIPLLEEFLSGCDLVKFARYQPNIEEVKQTVHTCESFLTRTTAQKIEI